MVRWPAPDRLSRVSAQVLERFKKTAGAKELEQDAREWKLVNWPWMPDAPYQIVARASDDEARLFVGDESGAWVVKIITPPSPKSTAA